MHQSCPGQICGSIITQRTVATTAPAISTVSMPAPTRSATLIFRVTMSGSDCRGFSDPAAGFPLLSPPSSRVTGASILWISVDCITSSAAISNPMSRGCLVYFWSVHLSPHEVFLGPPAHVFAAALAEARSFGIILSYVNGASCVDAAIQRARYPLNDRWSTLQVSTGSQARSYRTSLGLSVKKTSAALRMPSVRSFHLGSPSVWIVSIGSTTHWGTYKVIHRGSAEQVYTGVICPLHAVHLGAVVSGIGSVVEQVVVRHEPDILCPVEYLGRPVGIRLVPCVSCESCGEVEEAPV